MLIQQSFINHMHVGLHVINMYTKVLEGGQKLSMAVLNPQVIKSDIVTIPLRQPQQFLINIILTVLTLQEVVGL